MITLQEVNEDIIHKTVAEKEATDLKHLVYILHKSFSGLNLDKNNDAVIVLGNSGTGMSTLMTGLCFGPNALQEEIVNESMKIETGLFNTGILKEVKHKVVQM